MNTPDQTTKPPLVEISAVVLPGVANGVLPLPKPLFPCEYCAAEYSWPADDLFWSAASKAWICIECWNDDSHGERGIRLDREIQRQNGSDQATARK